MIGATLGIAFLFVVLALSRRNPGAALGILIMSMLLWPEFLRVPVGIVQMSVPRFVAVFLLIKFMAQGRHRQINFGRADTLVILMWLWTIFATFIADAAFTQVTQMIGRGLDTVLMYFVARMALTSREDVKGLYWGMALTALAMCAAGSYEALTWHSPYHQFSSGAARIEGYSEIRYGMLRAQSSTQNSIYFGMAMMLVTGVLWSVRGYVQKQFRYKLVALAATVAALSSLSSGPWLALAALLAMNLYYKQPSMIKPSLYGLMALALVMEVASNRHFYNLIDYLALDPHTAWYRTRLLEVAVTQWQDYWLVGVGSTWPHHWAAKLDGRQYIDVVNNFVIIALYGGLPALFMYVATHVIAVKRTILAFRRESDIPRRQLVFSLAATLIALDFSSMSVGLFGPAQLLSFVLLGCSISASTAWVAAPQGISEREDEISPLSDELSHRERLA